MKLIKRLKKLAADLLSLLTSGYKQRKSQVRGKLNLPLGLKPERVLQLLP
jgi:hypothetical protein